MIRHIYASSSQKSSYLAFQSLILPGLLALLYLIVPSATAQEIGATALDETDLSQLKNSLKEMKALAPKLRIQLRTVRSQVAFDVRQIHNIERSISQAERDITRLIMMHEGNRFNQLRAHFLGDDLRRKAKSMHQGESYVESKLVQLQENPDQRMTVLLEQYNQLRSLLGAYTQLIDESLNLMTLQHDAP